MGTFLHSPGLGTAPADEACALPPRQPGRQLAAGVSAGVGGYSPPTPPPQRVWEWSWRPSPDSSPSWSPRLESPPELFLAARTCQQQDRRGRRGLAGRGRLAELWGETRGVSRPRRQQMPHGEPPQCVSKTEPVGSTGGGALGPDPGPGAVGSLPSTAARSCDRKQLDRPASALPQKEAGRQPPVRKSLSEKPTLRGAAEPSNHRLPHSAPEAP